MGNFPVRTAAIAQLRCRTFPWLADRHDAAARLTLAAAGFAPVTSIAAGAFGADLRSVAIWVLLPLLSATALVLSRRPLVAALVPAALLAGAIATLLYDAYRFGFLGVGLMHEDPIPHIGVALHLQPHWVFGYLWRYLGNGGGLAVAFVALGLSGVRAGVLYGLFVCSGLLVTLVASPYGEQLLWPLTTTTLVMAVGGHVIYGAGLGWITAHRSGPRRSGTRPGVASTRQHQPSRRDS